MRHNWDSFLFLSLHFLQNNLVWLTENWSEVHTQANTSQYTTTTAAAVVKRKKAVEGNQGLGLAVDVVVVIEAPDSDDGERKGERRASKQVPKRRLAQECSRNGKWNGGEWDCCCCWQTVAEMIAENRKRAKERKRERERRRSQPTIEKFENFSTPQLLKYKQQRLFVKVQAEVVVVYSKTCAIEQNWKWNLFLCYIELHCHYILHCCCFKWQILTGMVICAISVPEMFQILNFIWSNFRWPQSEERRQKRREKKMANVILRFVTQPQCVISNLPPAFVLTGAPTLPTLPPNFG